MRYLMSLFAVCIILPLYAQNEKTIEKSFDGINSVELSTGSGDVQFKKGNTKTVSVKVIHDYDDDEVEFILDQKGDRLVLKEKFESRSSSGESNWTLTIPDNLEVKVNSGSGDTEINDLMLDLKMNSGSGDLTANSVSGDISLNCGSGDFSIEGSTASVSINSGSGNVEIADHDGEFKVNIGSGDVELRNSMGAFKLNSGSGDIEVMEVEITDASAFNAGSGDVSVSLAKELDHNISLASGSGNAELNFNGNEISGEIIMEANKRNGDINAPFDFDESEEIENGQTKIRKTVKLGNKDITIKVFTGSGKATIKK